MRFDYTGDELIEIAKKSKDQHKAFEDKVS
jgi:hypothetical protein